MGNTMSTNTSNSASDSARLSGLDDSESHRIGKDWHPFGREEDHVSAVKEAQESNDDNNDDENDTDTKKKDKNPLHAISTAFKKLGSKTKGKSHRFGDLLRLHKEVQRDLSDPKLYPELEKDAVLR